MSHHLFDFSHLTAEQRVELAVALWESLPGDSSEPPLADSQRTEIVKRLEEYRRNPHEGAGWKEVRERIADGSAGKHER